MLLAVNHPHGPLNGTGMENSVSGIAAVKLVNKGTAVLTGQIERRTEPEGNPGSQSTHRAQDRERVTREASRMRQFKQREPRERLTTLLHHATVEALRGSFFELKMDASAGMDDKTWRMCEEGL